MGNPVTLDFTKSVPIETDEQKNLRELSDQVSSLRKAMSYAASQNPDQYAKLITLHRQTGVPPVVSQGNEAEVKQAADVNSLDYETLVASHPRTVKWASNPDNAAVAGPDEVQRLAGMESRVGTIRALTPWESFEMRYLYPAREKLMAFPATRYGVDAVAGVAGMVGGIGSFLGWHGDGASRENALQRLESYLSPENANLNINGRPDKGNALDEVVKNVAPMIPAVIASGGTGLLARTLGLSDKAAKVLAGFAVGSMFTAEQGGNTYTQMAGAGASDYDARLAANRVAAINAPLNLAFGVTDLVPFLKNNPLATSLVLGGTQGATGQFAQNLVTDKPLTNNLWQSALQGMAIQGGMHLGMGFFEDMAHIVTAAEQSKLRTRSPEKFHEAMTQLFDGQESLRIPAEQFDGYFQSKNLDPVRVAQDIGAKNYLEAKLSGGDVEVAPADFVGKLDPEHQKGLLGDVVNPVSGMTLNQQAEAEAELQKWVESGGPDKLSAETANVDQQTQASAEYQAVKTQLRDQYIQAGETPEIADNYATLQANVYSNLARETGLKPSELVSIYRPVVKIGEAPAASMGQGERGWFRALPDGSFEIGKTKIGDISTFIHEPAHSYLEIIRDLASDKNASAGLKSDYGKILDFLGAKDGEQLTTDQHEKWARANEAYLREGKSPSDSLRGVFQRFAVWLTSIYKRASDLGVELSDDIRGVFDRMYAAEDGVNRVEKESGPQLFSTPEEAGWTPEQFKAYAESKNIEVEQAKSEILSKLNEAAVRERSQAWKEEEANVREAVTTEVDRRPEQIAIRTLRDGKLPDGTPLALNRDALVKQFGEERVKNLNEVHKAIYRKTSGVDAEAAAEILGYNSGEELIRALETTPRRSQAIEQATRDYMTAKHGDIRYDGSLQDQATLALENDRRAANLHRELQSLVRRNNPEFELREAHREAKQLIKEQESAQKAKETKQTAKDMTSLANGLLEENAKQAAAIERRQQRIDKLQQRIMELEAKAKATAQEQAAGNRFAQAIPPVDSFRQAAETMVASKPLMDLQPQRYLDASRISGREAHDALAKGDYWGARQAKQKELINHFLYREAAKAKAEAEKTLAYVGRYSSAKVREKIAQAGGAEGQHVYLDQIDNILEQFRFKQETNKSIVQQRMKFEQFAALKQAEAIAEFQALNPDWAADHPGETPEIPQVIDTSIAGMSKNYRELTITELRAVRDALKNVEQLARNEYGILRNGKLVSFAQEVADFERVSRENNTPKAIARSGAKFSAKERLFTSIHGLDAYMQKIEWLVDRLDGGDINGPARRNIKKPIDDAWGESLKMGDEIFTKLKALIDARPKEDVASLNDSTGIQFPKSDRPLNRRQLISWAMNLGTEENQKVALIGEGLLNLDGSVSPLVQQALSTLRKSELDFIQGTWDILEGMKPAIRDKALRTTGVEPKLKKVTPFDVTTADGEQVHMRGGYYPLKSEPGDRVGQKQTDPANLAAIGFQRPKTSTSHLQQVTGATYRLLLDYEHVLSKHLADVISDTTKGEAVSQVYKFISEDRVRTTLQETLGDAESREFLKWLQDFAGNNKSGAGDSSPFLHWLMARRSGMVVARLGGNLTSYLIQAGDVFKSFADPDIQTKYLAKAFLDIRRNPTQTIEEIRALSPNEMRFREKNFNRDIRDMLESKSPFDQKKQVVTEFLMDGFAVMDRMVTFPAWLARFRQGMELHGDQARAVQEADRAIARTYMAGDNRNMSRMMRQGGLTRLLTTFQGDANTWYGIISAAVRSGNPRAISVGLMALVAEQVVTQLIRNRGPKDDENYAGWATEQVLLAGLSKIPVFGDVAQYGLSKLTGRYASLQNPTMQALEKTATAPGSIYAYSQGKKDAQEMFQDLTEATGIYVGVPGTSQAIRTWKYVHRLQTGKEPEPSGPIDAVRGAVMGSNKKR